MVIDGKTNRCVNHTDTYSVSKHASTMNASLVDRGANGGIAGEDVRLIDRTHGSVDVRGIDNHQLTNVPIVTAGGVATSQHGEVIIILNQYAYTGKGKSIHSCAQLEWYKADVNDRSIHVGGLQRIQTIDGYVHPTNIVHGLAYVGLRSYTDAEWDTFPHVMSTSDALWDPTVLDHDMEADDQWFDAVMDLTADPQANLFDEFGAYRKRHVIQAATYESVLWMPNPLCL